LRDVTSKQREVTEADGSKRKFGGVELGAKIEDTVCQLDGKDSVGLGVYQLPGSNALETAEEIKKTMARLKKDEFPAGVDYAIVYDTTPFIDESITAVKHTLIEAFVLVGIVVLVFLQTWRATLIPLLAVPVAIVGTFAVMLAVGFSINNLSLLGMVLAIGIVVDDAIVVVEAVEHHLEHGLSPNEATRKAMDEVANPIVAITLVLMCVFVPCAFIPGITGQFFKQFAVTVAVSTFFSGLNSLTLSPALCALLLRPKAQQRDPISLAMNFTLGWFFTLFNRAFEWATAGYARIVGWTLRLSVIALLVYGGLLFLTYFAFTSVPTGFVPLQDKGYLVVDVQLPDASSLERTKQVMAEIDRIARGDPNNPTKYPGIKGIAHTVSIPGQSVLQGANGSNFGAVYVVLEPFEHRHEKDQSGPAVAAKLRTECFRHIQEAKVAVFGAPAIDGLGNAGGFKLMIQDLKGDLGLEALQAAADDVAEDGNKRPGLVGMFNTLRADTPQMFVDVNRTKCKEMGVPLNDVFLALQVYLGGYYVNDINRFGRTWQVNIQADPGHRVSPDDVKQLKVRNARGDMVPLSSVVDIKPRGGPLLIMRYNGKTAATINGASAPTMSSGDMIKAVEASTKQLPEGMDKKWTELTYMQMLAGSTAIIVFAVAVILVYLLLAAQYESLRLPMAIILVVPMCLLCSVVGVALARMDINIFVQIGFVVLVGLASKNAILIVEFAKEERDKGMAAYDAAIKACKLRLRPILMTSFAFILGVVPLAISTGAGAEMRRPLGIAVFAGMLGVTVFGIFLTPVFYYVLERLGGEGGAEKLPVQGVPALEAVTDRRPDGVVTYIAKDNG
jgi:multidrug efflux pump